MPNISALISPTGLVNLTGVQTITNKTLVSPGLNNPTVSGTVAGNATFSGNITFTNPISATVTGVTTVANGGTGATTAAAARTNLGAGDVTTDTAQTITAPKRGTVTADNDLSFNMAVTNNFTCTTAGSGTLTFTNITAGQSGFILLTNASNHTISAAATTKVSNTLLSRISASGTYLLSYFSNGTNVYVVASEAFV